MHGARRVNHIMVVKPKHSLTRQKVIFNTHFYIILNGMIEIRLKQVYPSLKL